MTTQAAYDPEIALYTVRVATSDNWPLRKTYTTKNTALAGFVDIEKSDKVECFYCGLEISVWEKMEDPLLKHFSRKRDCGYIICSIVIFV